MIYSNNIAVDDKDVKWIVSNEEGLASFNGNSWNNYYTSDGLVTNYLFDIYIDKWKRKWVYGANGAFLGGVTVIDNNVFTSYGPYAQHTGPVSNAISDMVVADDGTAWFTNFYYGVNSFKNGMWKLYNTSNTAGGLSENGTSSVVVDKQNKTWIGTRTKGVCAFDGVNWSKYTVANTNGGLVSDEIYSMAVDSKNLIWIATNKGVNMFDGTIWTNYTRVNTNGGLVCDKVYDIDIDKLGNIWFTTDEGYSVYGDHLPTKTININAVNNAVDIFPNPTQGNFVVNFNRNIIEGKVFIRNVEGKLIEEINIQNQSSLNLNIYDSSGFYFIELDSNNESQVFKLLKTN